MNSKFSGYSSSHALAIYKDCTQDLWETAKIAILLYLDMLRQLVTLLVILSVLHFGRLEQIEDDGELNR